MAARLRAVRGAPPPICPKTTTWSFRAAILRAFERFSHELHAPGHGAASQTMRRSDTNSHRIILALALTPPGPGEPVTIRFEVSRHLAAINGAGAASRPAIAGRDVRMEGAAETPPGSMLMHVVHACRHGARRHRACRLVSRRGRRRRPRRHHGELDLDRPRLLEVQ